MKKETKQIQSYISIDKYNQLKKLADDQGLLFATFIRQILTSYLINKDE